MHSYFLLFYCQFHFVFISRYFAYMYSFYNNCKNNIYFLKYKYSFAIDIHFSNLSKFLTIFISLKNIFYKKY